MLQNPQKDLRKTRQELMVCLSETLPTKEFSATIIMAMVRLHVIEARIRKTQDIIERRRLINEFNNRRNTIERGIQLLWKSSGKRDNKKTEAHRRAVS